MCSLAVERTLTVMMGKLTVCMYDKTMDGG